MSTGRFEVSELAGEYFDWERIHADPDSTYLSEYGMLQAVAWLGILEENGYLIDSPSNIEESAEFLIAEGDSNIDALSTKIILAILASAVETLDAS